MQRTRRPRAAVVLTGSERVTGTIADANGPWLAHALTELGFDGPVGRQIVLTGGGAEMKGIADYAQQSLGRSVRIGRPRGLTALPDAHSGPAFATLAGLAFHAASDPVDLRAIEAPQQTVVRPKGGAMLQRLMAAFKANY